MERNRVALLVILLAIFSVLSGCGDGGNGVITSSQGPTNTPAATPGVTPAPIPGIQPLPVPPAPPNSITNPPTTVTPPAPGIGTPGAFNGSNFIFVAHDGPSLVSGFQLNSTTGALVAVAGSPFPGISGTGVRSITATGAGRFVFVISGLSGGTEVGGPRILGFSIDRDSGSLSALPSSPFLAPDVRAIAADPLNAFLFAVTSTELIALRINTDGSLLRVGGIGLPAIGDVSDIKVHPSGNLIYIASNSSTTPALNGVLAFRIDRSTGVLTALNIGNFTPTEGPDSLAIDPQGTLLFTADVFSNASGSSRMVHVFRINPGGDLSEVPGSPFANLGIASAGSARADIAVDRSGRFLFVTNSDEGSIRVFTIDRISGTLVPVFNSPFGIGGAPSGLAVDGSNRFLVVGIANAGSIAVFQIDVNTGVLTQVVGSPFPSPDDPADLIAVPVL